MLTTRRLHLRSGGTVDAAALTEAIAHWDVVRMLERVPWPYMIEDARWWLARSMPVSRPEPLIVERASRRIVGGIRLVEKDAPELGHWITPAAWGRGYATEAARAMAAWGRDAPGLTEIGSGHFADNPASGRVLAKAGFHPTGRTGARPCLARGEELPFIEWEWRV